MSLIENPGDEVSRCSSHFTSQLLRNLFDCCRVTRFSVCQFSKLSFLRSNMLPLPAAYAGWESSAMCIWCTRANSNQMKEKCYFIYFSIVICKRSGLFKGSVCYLSCNTTMEASDWSWSLSSTWKAVQQTGFNKKYNPGSNDTEPRSTGWRVGLHARQAETPESALSCKYWYHLISAPGRRSIVLTRSKNRLVKNLPKLLKLIKKDKATQSQSESDPRTELV